MKCILVVSVAQKLAFLRLVCWYNLFNDVISTGSIASNTTLKWVPHISIHQGKWKLKCHVTSCESRYSFRHSFCLQVEFLFLRHFDISYIIYTRFKERIWLQMNINQPCRTRLEFIYIYWILTPNVEADHLLKIRKVMHCQMKPVIKTVSAVDPSVDHFLLLLLIWLSSQAGKRVSKIIVKF